MSKGSDAVTGAGQVDVARHIGETQSLVELPRLDPWGRRTTSRGRTCEVWRLGKKPCACSCICQGGLTFLFSLFFFPRPLLARFFYHVSYLAILGGINWWRVFNENAPPLRHLISGTGWWTAPDEVYPFIGRVHTDSARYFNEGQVLANIWLITMELPRPSSGYLLSTYGSQMHD